MKDQAKHTEIQTHILKKNDYQECFPVFYWNISHIHKPYTKVNRAVTAWT